MFDKKLNIILYFTFHVSCEFLTFLIFNNKKKTKKKCWFSTDGDNDADAAAAAGGSGEFKRNYIYWMKFC